MSNNIVIGSEGSGNVTGQECLVVFTRELCDVIRLSPAAMRSVLDKARQVSKRLTWKSAQRSAYTAFSVGVELEGQLQFLALSLRFKPSTDPALIVGFDGQMDEYNVAA